MFKNYIQIAIRTMRGNRLYSAINIIGLAVGLAACMLLMLYVQDELSYDRQWADSNRLVRLETKVALPGREPFQSVQAAGPIKEAIKSYFPEDVVTATRFNNQWPIIRVGDDLYEESLYFTDPETADIFDLQSLHGDVKQTLNDAGAIALSRKLAVKYFGKTDVVGEILTISIWSMNRDFKVGAVYEDLPSNTVLSFNALIKINESDFANQSWLFSDWFSSNNHTIIKLKPGVKLKTLQQGMPSFIDKYMAVPPFLKGQVKKISDVLTLTPRNLVDVQLYPTGQGEMKPTGSVTSIYLFASIALLILFIACINFMNLSMARSTRRAKEVSLRKVMGASRGQLITQFLGETSLLALISLLIGVSLVELTLPAYNSFLGKDMMLSFYDPLTWITMGALLVFIGLTGGFYPAFILSSYRPALVLKANKSNETRGSMAFRNLLVIFQFAVSIALIISSAVIYFQRSYITSMDLGYDAENIMMVHGTGRDTVRPKNKMLREEIKKIPGVINASYTFTLPGVREEGGGFVMVPDISGEQKIMIQTRWIDEDYLDTYKVQLLAGREYDRNNTADQYPNQNAFDNYTHPLQHNLLINEAAIQYLGLGNTPEEALGKVIRFGVERYVDFTVIGVTANVQHHSLRDSIRPEIHPMINGDWGGFMAVRMQGDPRPVQAAIEKFWREKVSDVPFVYSYAQDRMEEDFKKEEAMASMMTVASVLAIFVACMGLFGLASFAAERRTKEIGVRKVMGAQVRDIVGLLIWQFSKPVIMASMVAWPLTCYGLIQWLNGFPYRIDYWWFIPLCLISGLIALLIAWGTVGGNAAKVARSNPIKALRYE